jgi:signal transduction histidine kinase
MTGQDAVLQVTDAGADIPAEELPHVFDRFSAAARQRRPPAAASVSRSRPNRSARTAAS